MIKPGDRVRTTIRHLSTFGDTGTVKSTVDNFVYVEFDNRTGIFTFQSESLELVQEEPMKVDELRDAILNRELPPPMTHVFRVTVNTLDKYSLVDADRVRHLITGTDSTGKPCYMPPIWGDVIVEETTE